MWRWTRGIRCLCSRCGSEVPSIDAEAVSAEIMAAFHDVPRPDRYVPEDHVAYGRDEELDYLVDKTWLDIAGDASYMIRHSEAQFFFMTKECLFYLFPGYLLGVINHKPESVVGVTMSLLSYLSWYHRAGPIYDRYSYLCDRFTPEQKKVVAHWLQLVLERDKERSPELYGNGARPTLHQLVFHSWEHWA